MSLKIFRTYVVSLLMVAGAGLAVAMTPTQQIADTREKADLETMIPSRIGDWRIDTTIVPIEPSPEARALLEKIYSQTLSRTYINSAGQRVMLSIAYGGNQNDSMKVHQPEVCYAAQGFEIVSAAAGLLLTEYGELPVKRLFAVQRGRNEPITYWVTVGDKATPAGFSQKIAQVSYGLTGKVPDGFLVRVSTIDRDAKNAYQMQEEFLRSMLTSMPESDRLRIAGRFGA